MMTLSKKQKAILAQMARAAWEAMAPERRQEICEALRHDDDLRDPWMSEAQCFAHWRHAQQAEACGEASLRAATQDDFLRLRAWWENLLPGQSGRAFRDLVKAESEPRGRAAWLLRKACEERGLAWPEYPASICRTQNRCELRAASEKQLWRLIFTIRNRRSPGGARRPVGRKAVGV